MKTLLRRIQSRCSRTYDQLLGHSLPAHHFDQIYQRHPDPWQYQTSDYEARKYAQTLAALPRTTYTAALEIGCSIGVMTAQLADRCDSLLAVDISEVAIARARDRCRDLPQVDLQVMQIPQRFPARSFDLMLVSEVGSYWSKADLRLARQRILDHLQPGGHLLLVHFIPKANDFRSTGDEVHQAFLQAVPDQLQRLFVYRESESFRLDLLERV